MAATRIDLSRSLLLLAIAVGWCLGRGTSAAALRTVALSGMPIPDSVSGETFARFGGVNLNNDGKIAFYGLVSGPTVTTGNDTGIWSEGGGSLAVTAREGTQAPGLPAGVNFGDFSVNGASPTLFNTSGSVVFPALLTGAGITTGNNSGLWLRAAGGNHLVARNGDRAPGTPDGVRYSDIQNVFSSSRVSLDEVGVVAYTASTATDGLGPRDPGYFGSGIWKDAGGTLSVIARSGDAAPNFLAGATFGSFTNPLLAGDGQLVFRTTLAGVGGSRDDGIWSAHNGVLQLVAQEGNQAPQTPSGVVYDSFGKPTINDAGQLAFQARIRGNIGSGDYGVWGGAPNDLKLLALDRDAAPGIADEVFDSSFGNPFSNPTIGSSGAVAFAAQTRMLSTTSQSMGVWAARGGSLQLIAALDAQVPPDTQLPPIPGNVAFRAILGASLGLSPNTGSGPAINAAGQVAFAGLLMGDGIDGSNDVAIWAEDRAAKLQLIVREGDTIEVAPGDFRKIAQLLGGVVGGGPTAGSRTTFNDWGQIAFQAVFVDGTEGIFVSNVIAVPEPPSNRLLAACALLMLFMYASRVHLRAAR